MPIDALIFAVHLTLKKSSLLLLCIHSKETFSYENVRDKGVATLYFRQS